MNAPSPLRRKTSGERVGRPPLPDLERFGPRLARLIEHRLRSVFGAPVGCRFDALAMTKFGAAGPTAPESSVAVACLDDGVFAGFLDVDTGLVARILELSLGLPPSETDPPARRPTPVDQALARPFAEDLLDCLSAAIDTAFGSPSASPILFSRYVSSTAALLEIEADADMLEIGLSIAFTPNAPARKIALRVTLAALDRMRGAPPEREEPAPPPPRDPRWGVAMRRAAAGADLRMIAVLRRMRMNLGEASEMRPGDIIPLSRDGGMNVELALAGQAATCISAGRLGAANDRRAVKIVSPPDPELTETVRALLGL